ncbi:MAG: nicotinate (nicotinamide) nucleotide adenylyltransferase [Gemmatimonadetes bacterium]|jgi:nicotinate-nucleotide adenylyltransferase|nr:nicotinate (nicotinamide) nucleotide adenylyltransferase [Gemmatimonadota bacterium]MBP6668389.1 nicotinate-nucleotide adenylyltransferase [Gemmatimonadales bacterium]MBK7785400.1 nicotinate (nicotinamide) nucleotide adenylyltransferase [Gemmatimonadota bacterium]MBK7923720.1 nicotinate (nicotinamide) nucleotide adenylyltransferase [Gemmatimonadota bacterium]MBK9069175.1 nicotinate (nicotinamide) nucleotide adenylyltransferase [Gemmatimonadota bacterium]
MIGLLGGSFDPIHHGHLLVAQAVLEALGLEQVRFVPAREQPFKIGRHGAPAAARARMVALAIAGEPRFALEPLELERPGPSYTVDTLRALRAREPDREFALLVGADAARDLPTWHQADALVGLATLVVFARSGVEVPVLPWPCRRVAVPEVEISATTVRARVASGRPIRYWVPEPVAGFISANGLYLADA